jgi:hypothetical protein
VADTDAELADGASGLESATYKLKSTNSSDNLMFHYRIFGCPGGFFAAGVGCNLLQTVSDTG